MDGHLRAPALNQTPSALYALFFPLRLSAAFQKELHKFMKLVSVLQIIVRKLRRAHVSMETPPSGERKMVRPVCGHRALKNHRHYSPHGV